MRLQRVKISWWGEGRCSFLEWVSYARYKGKFSSVSSMNMIVSVESASGQVHCVPYGEKVLKAILWHPVESLWKICYWQNLSSWSNHFLI